MSSGSLSFDPSSETGSTTVRLDAALVLQIARRNGPTFLLMPDGTNTIGRAADADIVIPDRLASRCHAVIEQDPSDGRWQVRDLKSRNGTWVDGRRVDEVTLQPGMTVQIGTTELIFRTFSRRTPSIPSNHAEQIVRCGPVAELEGSALQRVRSGSSDDNRRTMLLYQMSIHLLSSRSTNDIMTAAVELATEHTGADAVGWFDVAPTDEVEPVLVVPPSSELTDRVRQSACHRLSGDGQAVWVARNNADGTAAGGSYDLVFVPVLENERPWAAICASTSLGSLRDSDFDFLVALASLTAAACAGQADIEPPSDESKGIPLDSAETVKASPEDFRSMAGLAGRSTESRRVFDQLGDSLLLDDWQRLLVQEALRRADGRVPEAAEALGISRATLYRKLDQYGFDREDFRNPEDASSTDHADDPTPPSEDTSR